MEIAVVLLLLVLVLGGQVLLFSKYLFRNFRYRCSFDRQEVFEGEQIQMVETVLERKGPAYSVSSRRHCHFTILEFADTESSLTDETRFVPSFFMLKGYQKITRRWKVTCARRGELRVRSISLVSSDLLGLRYPESILSRIGPGIGFAYSCSVGGTVYFPSDAAGGIFSAPYAAGRSFYGERREGIPALRSFKSSPLGRHCQNRRYYGAPL